MMHYLTITLSAGLLWISNMMGYVTGARILVLITVVAIVRPRYKKLTSRRRW